MGTIKENKKSKIKNQKLGKIYILHGWSYSTEKWEPFLEELKKSGVEGVLLKIPGLTAPLDTPWTLDDYVDWLHNQVASSRKLVAILGHSNGGRIALAFTLKYPEKVEKLFLFDSAGIYHKDLLIRIKRKVFKKLSLIGKKNAPEFARKILYKFAREHDYEKSNPVMKTTMKNLILKDLQPELYKIKTPTVIIWGKKDKVTPFKDAMTMHLLIKNSQLFPITGAAHSPQFTHVREVAQIVLSQIT